MSFFVRNGSPYWEGGAVLVDADVMGDAHVTLETG